MISLYWLAFLDANCTAYQVYRAITGLIVPFPNGLGTSDKLILSATSIDTQTITFSAMDIDSMIAQINSTGKGLKASKNLAGTKMFVRCTATHKARMKLYPSSFLTNLGQSPRIIVPGLEYQQVGAVARVNGTYNYTFTDPDGSPLDWYYITSLGTSESIPSRAAQPVIPLDLMCVLEGRITDSQNNPAGGAEVIAFLRQYESHEAGENLTKPPVKTVTDSFGRFLLPLVRCQQYVLQVPSIGYNETILLPNQDVANLNQLVPTLAGRFSPFGDPQ